MKRIHNLFEFKDSLLDREIEKELAKVNIEYRLQIQEIIQEKSSELAYLNEKIEDYYLFSSYLTEKLEMINNFHETESYLYMQMMNSIYSINLNIKNGCIVQASQILRSLLETAFTVKFIFKDENTYRAKIDLYEGYLQYTKLISKKDLIKPGYQIELSKYEIQKLNELSKKYAKKPWYDDFFVMNNKKKDNKKTTIYGFAKEAGMISEYDNIYSKLSDFTHGSYNTISLFSDGRVYNGLSFSKEAAFYIGMNCVMIANQIINEFVTKKDYVIAKNIIKRSEALVQDVSKFIEDVYPNHLS